MEEMVLMATDRPMGSGKTPHHLLGVTHGHSRGKTHILSATVLACLGVGSQRHLISPSVARQCSVTTDTSDPPWAAGLVDGRFQEEGM